MKAVIFAGGVGTRLWPLSRQKSPKQFEKIIGDKSTLQLTIDRLRPEFKFEDIYISTGAQYTKLVAEQIPELPKQNIIGEPLKKDVGPAVALAMAYIQKKAGGDEPVIILWSDHMVKDVSKFKKIVKAAEHEIQSDKNKMVFIGQKPRFASENLGWIEFGETEKTVSGISLHKFSNLKYKPSHQLAQKYFKDLHYCWNLGYFVATPDFILNLFKEYAPKIYRLVGKITDSLTGNQFQTALSTYYEQMPELHFDTAIFEQLDKRRASVIVEDIGWSDVGAWEALKETLVGENEDNITKGRVLLEDSSDNLVYNYEEKKMVVGIDLEDLLVVNTRDVLLVAKKTSVSKIKKLVESFQGTEHEKLT